MPAYEAYGQTDIWSDPGWLRATASGRGRQAKLARERIQDLQQEAGRRQQAQQFTASHAQQEQQRADALNLRKDIHDENLAQRQERQQGLQADREKSSEDRRTLMLTHLLSDPNTDPTVKKSIQDHMLKQAGVQATLPVDPKMVALAKSKGLPPPQPTVIGGSSQGTAPSPTSVAPSAAAAKAQTQQQTNEATYPTGSYSSGIEDQTPMIGGSPAIPSNRLIQHGQIYGGPPGRDLNINTGEFVPSDLVGTINGRPATQVIAEGALKSGVSPEDTRSRGVYNAMRSDPSLAANQPPPNETMYPNPIPNTGVAGTSPSRGPAISNWSPSQLAGQPQPTEQPQQTPPATPGTPTQFGSGAMSSGTRSGEWLAQQFADLGRAVGAHIEKPRGVPYDTGAYQPPTNPEEERRRQLAGQQ